MPDRGPGEPDPATKPVQRPVEPASTPVPSAEPTAKPEPTTAAKPEPESAPAAKPEPGPTAAAKPEPDAGAKPEPTIAAKPEPESAPAAKPEPEPTTAAKPEPEPVGKPPADQPSALTITFPHPLVLLERLVARLGVRPAPGAEAPTISKVRSRPSGITALLLGENGLPRFATFAVTILAVAAVVLASLDPDPSPGRGDPQANQSLSPSGLDPGSQPLDDPDSSSSSSDASGTGPSGFSGFSGSPSGLSGSPSIPGQGDPLAPGSQPTGSPPASSVPPPTQPPAAPTAPVAASAPPAPQTTPRILRSRTRVTHAPASTIPARARTAYTSAATRTASSTPACKLPWTILAAIGRLESDDGRAGNSNLSASTGRAAPPIYGARLDGSHGTPVVRDTDHGTLDADTSYDRAIGPLQFLPGTWPSFAVDADGDGAADPQDIDDAALTAARYLCTGVTSSNDLSTPGGQWSALYRYKRSASYANIALGLATTYETGRVTTVSAPPAGASTVVPAITPSGTSSTTSTTGTYSTDPDPTTPSTTGYSSTTSTTTSSSTTGSSTTSSSSAPSTTTVTVTVTR